MVDSSGVVFEHFSESGLAFGAVAAGSIGAGRGTGVDHDVSEGVGDRVGDWFEFGGVYDAGFDGEVSECLV